METKTESNALFANLNYKGFGTIEKLVTPTECETIQELFARDLFRTTIDMQRYRFGKGEYKYFNYPLPPIIQQLRTRFYEMLVPLANDWMKILKVNITFPTTHEEFIQQCRAAGQQRPTPLILKYEEGGFNTLHQDLYGAIYFPFQLVIVLSASHRGGELVFVNQIPRAQSRADVVAPAQGDAVVFTTNFRPVRGLKGYYRANMKHGVSPILSGTRMALGIIFHDAV